jgi:hypothetical protein
MAIGLPIFKLEPFSKREAWVWLIQSANNSNNPGKVKISLRYLASIWRWHKSKVERFIKHLKDELLIETEIVKGKTRISICNYLTLTKGKPSYENDKETIIKTEARPNIMETLLCDSCKMQSIQATTLVDSDIKSDENEYTKALTRQNRDGFIWKKKKEKNQKKKKEESIKEKNIPYRDIKKEKVNDPDIGSILSRHANEVFDFAASIAIEPQEVEWELGKFKDHLECSEKKPPKNMLAAFRNWLRRSVEFNRFKGRNGQFNQTKSEPTSFERFLIAGARAIAERKRRRLDRGYARERSIFMPESACDKQGFHSLQPVN